MASPRSASSPLRARFSLSDVLSVLPGLAFLGWFVGASWFENAGHAWFLLCDDAMVSMTYARTLVDTGEWVWFPGAERVQGFTNPLWTLFMALLHAMGLSGSMAALGVILSGVVLVVLCAVTAGRIVHALLRDDPQQRLASAVTMAVVPLLYPLVFWSLRGMEVGLLAALLLAVALAVVRVVEAWETGRDALRPLAVIGAASALGVATRLDFVVFVVVVVGALAWWAPRKWPLALAAVPPVAAATVVLAFQRLYYGDWLPNTYALKMEGVPVVDRVLHGVWTLGKSLPWLLLAALGLTAILRHVGEGYVRRAALVLAAAITAGAGYHVWVGGDAWETSGFANRFLSVALPLVIVLVIRGAAAWLASGAPGGTGLALGSLGAVAIAAGGLGLVPLPDRFEISGAVVGTVAAALAIPVAYLAVSGFRRRPHSLSGAAACLIAASFALLMVTSVLPAIAHMESGFENANQGDRHAIEAGLAIADVTDDHGTVAVWAAGAVGYYARRPMIDVLGKSDRRIAGLPARQTLAGTYIGIATGHNKWDLRISVRDLAPDVVYGPWNVPEILNELHSYGYEPRCTTTGIPLWVRNGTPHVHPQSLRACTTTELESH